MRYSLSFLLFVALLVGAALRPAAAQQSSQGAGYLGKSRSEYSIFVFGDSLAAGMWAGSQRAAEPASSRICLHVRSGRAT